ncbi:MAG: hypothetical protein ACKOU6_09935 [Planctomycetota bacterium]
MLAVESAQTACQFSLATADITPAVGTYHRMWGAATHDQSEGLHRPLRATLLRIEPQTSATPPHASSSATSSSNSSSASSTGHSPPAPLIWLALDHCLFGPPELSLVIEEMTRRSGRDCSQVLVIFSHTHAAGLMTLDRQDLPGGAGIADYLRQIGRVAGELLLKTEETKQPATIVYGQGTCHLAAHRDLWDKSRQEFVCGYHPDGPTDSTLIVARVTNPQQQILATFVNYACHPTTLAWDNRLISPDYPGAMRAVVEHETNAPCLFIQGASGDLGPVEGFVGDVDVADRNGRQLGFAALATLTALPPPATRYEYAGAVVSGATIGVWRHQPLGADRQQAVARWNHQRETLLLDYRPELPTIEQVEQERARQLLEESEAQRAGDEPRARRARALVERQTRLLARLQQLPTGSLYPLRIDVWRLGDAIWVAVPGELYSIFQLQLRASFPERKMIIATLAQGWGPSYIPPQQTYGTGIYPESIAVLAKGSLEKIIHHVQNVIERILEG